MEVIPCRITFGAAELTNPLASGFPVGCAELRLNGQPVVDLFEGIGAAAIDGEPKGNDSEPLSFVVPRHFATLAECWIYALPLLATLPRKGDLVIEFIGGPKFRQSGSLLVGVSRGGSAKACRVDIGYSFQGPPLERVLS